MDLTLGDYILLDDAELGFDPMARTGRVFPQYRPALEAARHQREVASEQATLMWGQTQSQAHRPINAGVILRPVGQPLYPSAASGQFPPGQCCPPNAMDLAYTDVTSESLDTTPLEERLIEGDLLSAMGKLGVRGLGGVAEDRAALHEVQSGIKSVREQAYLGNFPAADRALDYAYESFKRIDDTAMKNQAREELNNAADYRYSREHVMKTTPGAAERAQADMASRIKSAQGAARTETKRALAQQDRDRKIDCLLDPIGCAEQSADTLKKAAVAVVVVGGIAAGIAAYMHGRGMRRSNPRRRRRR